MHTNWTCPASPWPARRPNQTTLPGPARLHAAPARPRRYARARLAPLCRARVGCALALGRGPGRRRRGCLRRRGRRGLLAPQALAAARGRGRPAHLRVAAVVRLVIGRSCARRARRGRTRRARRAICRVRGRRRRRGGGDLGARRRRCCGLAPPPLALHASQARESEAGHPHAALAALALVCLPRAALQGTSSGKRRSPGGRDDGRTKAAGRGQHAPL